MYIFASCMSKIQSLQTTFGLSTGRFKIWIFCLEKVVMLNRCNCFFLGRHKTRHRVFRWRLAQEVLLLHCGFYKMWPSFDHGHFIRGECGTELNSTRQMENRKLEAGWKKPLEHRVFPAVSGYNAYGPPLGGFNTPEIKLNQTDVPGFTASALRQILREYRFDCPVTQVYTQ